MSRNFLSNRFSILLQFSKGDFHIGSIHINKLNAPGFFLAVIYILFEILAYFAYYDLKVAKEEELNSQNDTSPILNQDILSNDEGKLWIVTVVPN